VRGLDRNRAEVALRDAGFLVRVQFAPGSPAGSVLQQTPTGGTAAPRRTWVDVTIAGTAPAPSTAPRLPTPVPTDSAAAGRPPVTAGPIRVPPRTPASGTSPTRPAVRLPPRDSPKNLSTPALEGLPARDAIAAALRAGFIPVIQVDRSSGRSPGEVTAQSPASGTPALAGDLVRLSVSVGGGTGERSVDLPTVLGMDVDGARRLYQGTRVGVQVVTLDVPGHPYAGTGRVAAQYPVSSVPLSQAGAVTLWLVR
jgi:beta-lactam-binding protein with PASTA domain